MADDPQYNWIYKELVKGPDDVSGALAYVLYKTDKIAYIESFAKAHDGRQPNDDDLTEFRRMTNLEGALGVYRDRADTLLESFLDNALTEQLAIFKAELRTDAVINAVKPSFKSGVMQNIVAGIFTTLIAFGFVLGAWIYNEGPSKIIIGAANKMLGTETQTQQPPSMLTTK
jgi:hypothetical protein